ncbi:hypothetical protein UFOVP225_62 [uncultured Caudovirales phage]|uniref:Uncharacterized protein n=1 Tax=uncultured Caudovirales phage TaxID=2100421 RepID=A0A6J7WRB1_9CAUD|nr:hypothetical protein UFOVP113_75 [uncultured Caudovirales phage]CAB5219378.1 hypothetical protein UFOVP225_62 [uncultured Caudovirales phage]
MKFYIRRAILGIIATPLVAVAWCVFYALLIGLGGIPTQTIGETFANGLLIGSVLAILLTFAPQVKRLLG